MKKPTQSNVFYCAVDPGKHGYITFLVNNKVSYFSIDKPIKMIYNHLNRITANYKKKRVMVEKAIAYKGQGVKSIYSYLVPYGKLLGGFEILDFHIELVTPREWQKYFNLRSPKGLSRYEKRKYIKNMSIEKASFEWDLEVSDHNLADALLILKYFLSKEGINVER